MRYHTLLLIVALCCLSAGCSSSGPSSAPSPSTPAKSAPSGPAPLAPAPRFASDNAADTPAGKTTPGGPRRPAAPKEVDSPLVSTSTEGRGPVIRLRTGVALPQTGPEGILMSFSVDYLFYRGEPDPHSQYFLVIARTKGKPARDEIQLIDAGTLTVLAPGWRPEEGPFEFSIQDQSGRVMSEKLKVESPQP
jgi:hypothetical protein